MKMVRIVIMSIVLGILALPAFAAEKQSSAAVIVDVRSEAEWNEGHLQGAVLIPYDTIEQGIAAVAPDKSTRIYLYCRSGRRTGIAEETLKKSGYGDLVNLGTMENAARELQRPIVK